MRQVTAAIQKRRYLASREENGRFSWLMRNLGTYIANGYMVGKGEQNKPLEAAQTIGFDEIESALLGAALKEAPPKENAPGSYERLTRGFAQLEARGKTL